MAQQKRQPRKTGADLIRDERFRQVTDEGWTFEHDDAHDGCELVTAAYCYLHHAGDPHYPTGHPPLLWPWEPEAWKPSEEYTRNLVRAGALIAAEIDRLQRAGRT